MSRSLDVFRPPLVQDGDLCVGDKNLVTRLHEYFPRDRVTVIQRNAPGPDPTAMNDATVWYDIHPSGVARIGADSGAVPNLSDATLLKTAVLITESTELVTADWSGNTDDPLSVTTFGDSLKPTTRSLKQPSTQNNSTPGGDTGASAGTEPASAATAHRFDYQVQIGGCDNSVIVSYRNLDSGDTGFITRTEYTTYLDDDSTLNGDPATVIDLYEALELLALEDSLDGIGVVWINSETHDFELEEVIHPR